MGFFNSIKVNLVSFTQVTYEKDKWYKIDILLDWEGQDVAVFVNGDFKLTTKFYSL